MRLAMLLAAALGVAAPAAAQVAPNAVRSVEILPGWREPDGSRMAALAITLAPGWHTYWRVPGEAGIPPRFDWSRSGNLATVIPEWPRPDVFETSGLESYGFAREFILPLRLAPSDPAAPVEVDLKVDFGVCNDICIPASARVTKTLADAAPGSDHALITAALARRPRDAAEAGVASVTCGIVPVAGGYELAAEVRFEAPRSRAPVAVIESGRPDLWIGRARTQVDGSDVAIRAPVEALGEGGPILERQTLRMTFLNEDGAVEVRGCTPGHETAAR